MSQMRIWKKKRRKEDVVTRLRTETPVPSFLSVTPRLQLGSFQYNQRFRLSDFPPSLCAGADMPKEGPMHLGLHDPTPQHFLHTCSVLGSVPGSAKTTAKGAGRTCSCSHAAPSPQRARFCTILGFSHWLLHKVSPGPGIQWEFNENLSNESKVRYPFPSIPSSETISAPAHYISL